MSLVAPWTRQDSFCVGMTAGAGLQFASTDVRHRLTHRDEPIRRLDVEDRLSTVACRMMEKLSWYRETHRRFGP